jgi:aromatic-L-amino-acid/L-tryptophan decarboxylase
MPSPDTPAPRSDAARTDGLRPSLERLLPALEAFLGFADGPDPAARRSRWRPALDTPLPDEGLGAEAVLARLAEVVIPHGLRTGAPGFSGWVTTMPTTVPAVASLAGSLAASQRWWASPGNFLETLALRWLGQLLGLSPEAGGSFVSGGAVANLLGLAAARQHAGERLGLDLSRDGVAALPEPRVYAGDQVHHVVLRALGVLGLGRRALQRVPTDRRRGPDLARLEALLDEDLRAGRTPVAVVASAGDVNTGAIDPIDAMRTLAHDRGVWLHVDGAYGGFGVLDERVRPRYGDLSRVDSLAVDPHKWLAVPVGCGACLVRDPALLERAFALEPASYVKFARRADGDPGSPFDELGEGSADLSVEHSAPSRGLVVWAALAEIGARGMQARVARHLDCARRVAERVRAEQDLELLSEPVLSICCFRYRPPGVRDTATLERVNEAVFAGVRARGRCVPSSTRVDNKLAIRPCFIGPRSTLADADALVDEVLAVGRALT